MRTFFSLFLTFALAWLAPAVSAAPQQTTGGAAATPAAPTQADADEASRQYFTDLKLVTQDGKDVRFFSDVLQDRIVLINFIFTHCEGACPLMTRKLKSSRDLLDAPLRARVHFVSISIDPERDTPAAMKAFAAQHELADDKNWLFLTGDPQNVNQIVRKLGQYTPDVEEHSTLVLAGNVRDHYWMKISPMVPAEGIADKLRLLAQEQ